MKNPMGTMKWLVLAFLAVSVAASAATSTSAIAAGDAMPSLQGEFLTGRSAVLPQAAAGRVALLLFGFTYDSRFSVEPWATRFRHDFGDKPAVTFYEIPMISGFASMGKWFINSGMRSGTPKADQENVITVYGGSDPWKQRLEFRDPKVAYLILLDQNGKVAWRHAGNVDDDSYRALAAQMAKLLNGR
jgi:hypothetical protein